MCFLPGLSPSAVGLGAAERQWRLSRKWRNGKESQSPVGKRGAGIAYHQSLCPAQVSPPFTAGYHSDLLP